MYPLHLWHVVEDIQSTRRREACSRDLLRQAARFERARLAQRDGRDTLREAVAFLLIEGGLRLLTPRPRPQVRRAR